MLGSRVEYVERVERVKVKVNEDGRIEVKRGRVLMQRRRDAESLNH